MRSQLEVFNKLRNIPYFSEKLIDKESIEIKNNLIFNIYQNLNFYLKAGELEFYKEIELPEPVSNLITEFGFILAGGAIETIMRGEEPADYDFYLPVNFDLKKLEIIRKSYSLIENKYCLSFKIRGEKNYKIQIVKRLYQNISHIISSFDIDVCRFMIFSSSRVMKEVYGTINAIKSFETKKIYVNFEHESINFKRRLQKYRLKGYNIYSMYGELKLHFKENKIYSNYVSDYEYIGKNSDEENKNFIIFQNLIFLLKFLPDYMFIRNNEVYSLEDFEKFFENYRNKITDYNINYGYVDKKEVKIYRNIFRYTYNIHDTYRDKYIDEIIKSGYEEYLKIRNNVITQNVKNFHNVKYSKLYYHKNIRTINCFKYLPELVIIQFLKKKLSRPVMMKIMFYYFENLVSTY